MVCLGWNTRRFLFLFYNFLCEVYQQKIFHFQGQISVVAVAVAIVVVVCLFVCLFVFCLFPVGSAQQPAVNTLL